MRSVHMKIGIIDFRRLRAVEMTLQKRSPSIKNAHFWTFQTASEIPRVTSGLHLFAVVVINVYASEYLPCRSYGEFNRRDILLLISSYPVPLKLSVRPSLI